MKDTIHINDHLVEFGILTQDEVDHYARLRFLEQKLRSDQPLTVAEIAEASGCSEASVHARIQDSLAQLRNEFPDLKLHINPNNH